MTTKERCPWCNTDAEEAAARHEGPHATWCPHFRESQRGGPQSAPVKLLSGWTPPQMSVHQIPVKKPGLRSAAELKALGFEVVAKGETSGEITLYGDIGDSFWTHGVTANEFSDQIKKLKGVKRIDVRIDSDGGDVFQGETMYSLLRSHGAKIVTYVDGHAASAASFIAMAGDEIVIAESGFFMIHNARGGVMGSSTIMRAYADLVDRLSEKIAQIYVARTRQKIEKIREWMAADEGFGTWFDSEQSIEFGFADKVAENLRVAANVRHPDWFPNLPAALRPNRMKAEAALARMAARIR